MQIDAAFLTVIGFAGTWILIAFAVGVTYGRLSFRIDKNTSDIVKTESLLTAEVVRVESHFISEIKEMKNQFTTPDGEQRLLSYQAHDNICRRTTEAMLAEFKHVTQALQGNTAEIKEMSGTIGQMTVAIAVLEEGRDEHSRKNSRSS